LVVFILSFQFLRETTLQSSVKLSSAIVSELSSSNTLDLSRAHIKKLDGSEFRNAFSKASGSMIQKGTRLGALAQVMVDLILGVGVTATAIVEAKVTVRAEA
ncbi:hypothetical protein PanWU01x14_159900, partial [Parasponia andersonii]